ncbi:hypothetical protein OEZ86_001550 [Tetradesmus obliquus]|nr:hypothetical protein OEZ86_001550 [Tetradesmus obliquus]
MVLVLCIGDIHIPHRATDIPAKFRELLKPGKIHHVLCTGNLCSKSMLEFLRGICSDVKVVQGDFDDFQSPEHLVVELAGFKVGVCHGHQVVPWGDREALAILQRQMGADILVTGHTHEFKAAVYEELLQVNPGSATGAYSAISQEAVQPSFVLMDLEGGKATIYVYQLVDGEVKVEKIDHTKAAAAATAMTA